MTMPPQLPENQGRRGRFKISVAETTARLGTSPLPPEWKTLALAALFQPTTNAARMPASGLKRQGKLLG
jgi:hypothetical protein